MTRLELRKGHPDDDEERLAELREERDAEAERIDALLDAQNRHLPMRDAQATA